MFKSRLGILTCSASLVFGLAACQKDEPEPLPEQPLLAPGAACDPSVLPVDQTPDEEDDKDPQPICAPGLACEPRAEGDEYVCGTALSIRGRVTDSASGLGVEGALVAALNELGEPVTDVVASDACGDYILPVSVRRNADGSYAESLKWTLAVSASDYQPFPTGLRPALPIDMSDAEPAPAEADDEADTGSSDDGETYEAEMVNNAATNVALISLGADAQGVTISGSLGEGTAGTLVVAESGTTPAPYAIADASGAYTLFNVPAGAVMIRGYRQNVEIEPVEVTVGTADMADVDLRVLTNDPAMLATVSGDLNIVDGGSGTVTSVVLVPASVYNAPLERGPVPLGLRDPPPPAAPDVTGAFSLTGVPSGTYKVLVAFENDMLVRDPDEGIAGTQIPEIVVESGQVVAVPDSFKVTGALGIVGPGKERPEPVEAVPTFTWIDDSSEEGYDLVVFDALGKIAWQTEVPSGNGGNVTLEYGGEALEPGMYYQFRVTSWRLVQDQRRNISRTEDLRGVFVHGEAPPLEECTIDEEAATDGESSSGGESSSSTG
ncbi:carboxypeptidase-like regulatory domain-containing protein [Nannocystis sp. SCPEA4]|uniref:carboxypeptidase-like regulatory domain-containing protein n=1 Tax=Nannocystis sp. SCPEA4 TaxID=2996787 RepID=UPI00226F0695|nr:carboxypeptidase-like regulatory domain-containing protein [Nannocystis sp. SCPEA4]MCY1061150.1 carboxypeptidase-like regulatory domain-containing protein [Nannocystis sp. SCPEA4]